MIKNILILEDSSKAHFGGGQRVTLDIMNILTDEYRLILVDCKKDTIFKERAQKYADDTLYISCYGRISKGDTSSFSVGLLEILSTPFLYIKNILLITQFLKRNKYTNNNTLVYATTKKMLLLAYILKKIFGINYIFHAHSIDDNRSIFYKMIIPALKASSRIICVSDCVKSNINISQSKTIYNPITSICDTNKDISSKSKIIIASFSTLVRLKGIKYFMDSFKHLSSKSNVEFWIFGTGPEEEHLKQLESTNVCLKRFAKDVATLMSNDIDIVVVPSIISEACPMVLLEAFSYGIPVITTDIGGQAEIVKDGDIGFSIPIKNPQVIAEKIDYLIKNPQIYKKFSGNALNYAQNFVIKEYSKKISNLFKEIK